MIGEDMQAAAAAAATGYRLDVVAAGIVDVVACAGGWLYDRGAAGWQVNVFVPDTRDTRPLQILGVAAWELDAAVRDRRIGGHELAVSATAFTHDAAVREVLSQALSNPLVGATLWGDGWPMPIARTVHDVQHPLSAAAVTFKRQALIAAGLEPGLAETRESFLTDLRTYPSTDSDLVPLAR